MDLAQKKCVPCEGGVPSFTPEEIDKYRAFIDPSWQVLDHLKLERTLKFKDFKQAMAFVNQVAEMAEQEGHHPDIAVHYNKVTLLLWTHAIKGLSENDFILARKIDLFDEKS